MENSSDDAGSGLSQQTHKADAEPVDGSTSNIGDIPVAAEDQEEESLKEAILQHQLNRIDATFENNPSLVNTPWIQPNRETPLHFACRFGVNDVVAHLLDRNDIERSLHQVDYHGFLPLHRAICDIYDDWKLLKTMIDRTGPAGLVSKTNKEDTTIHLASRRGRVCVLNKLCPLLPEGAIDSLNAAGYPAIYECVEDGNVVSCLLKHGASPFTDKHGNTLLHAALAPDMVNAHRGIETRRALLARGEDLGAENDDKDTPFHLVARNLNSATDNTGMGLATLQQLLGLREEAPHHERTKSSLVGGLQKRNNVGDTVLHLIASKEVHGDKQRNAREAVENILGVCPNVVVSGDEEDNTPLHRACLVDNWFVAGALLQGQYRYRLGIDAPSIANLKNEEGDIPLHLAVRKGYLQTVKELMASYRSRETILIRNKREETPLHIAAAHGRPEMLKELLTGWKSYEDALLADQGRKLRGEGGMTPLHLAIERAIGDKATELVDQILSRSTLSEFVNEVERIKGWTALHFAASRGHERIVELLLLNGADSKKTDKDNHLAADIAHRTNHIDIADFIRRYRSRSFRTELWTDDGNANAKVDDHFLALSWPKWDKAVRQQRGGPPRIWPQMTPVNQFIHDNDTYYRTWSKDENPRRTIDYRAYSYHERWWFSDEAPVFVSGLQAPGSVNMPEAIDLAPIHQAQIRLSSCDREGWVMEERHEFERTHTVEKVNYQQRPNEKHANLTYFYDPRVFQNKKRLTRWIHFPANNRAWIEDLCRCMYSHGSLQSELIGILRFIEDNFEEVEGFHIHRYRKHGFITQKLEMKTDPPPSGHGTPKKPKAAARRELAATRSGQVKVPGAEESLGDEGDPQKRHSPGRDEERIGNEEEPARKYSAYSLVFPLLDMDFIQPGFRYIQESEMNTGLTRERQRSPSRTSSQRIGRMSTSTPNSEPSTDEDRKTAVQTHWDDMKALRERTTVHPPRSLDHYYHGRISSQELQKRVEDQVLTKFMKRQISGQEASLTYRNGDSLKSFFTLCSEMVQKLRLYTSRSRHPDRFEASMEEGKPRQAVGDTKLVEDSVLNTHATHSPLQILVVPQMWLWRFDNLVITSFPERWDCTSQRETLLDAIRERVEHLNIDRGGHPNELVTEILTACAEFQPTLPVGKQSFTWTEAFDDEIISVSRNNQSIALRFERNSQVSDAGFSDIFRDAMGCLRSIEDVLDELTSIKRVFQDQLQVWEKVHNGGLSCVVCNGYMNAHDGDREGKSNACASNFLPKRSLELASSLEEQALKVRESASILFRGKPRPTAADSDNSRQVVTQLTLFQGEASIENALQASEHSKVLAVFTLVTVIFVRL